MWRLLLLLLLELPQAPPLLLAMLPLPPLLAMLLARLRVSAALQVPLLAAPP